MVKEGFIDMKRVLLVAGVLFISVVSTACINNFAVQELNTKAKEFIENGDYTSAVERLKSSIDLDSSAYESYYNLAVAYTKLDDYSNAVDNYKKVIQIKPDFADAYYSLAVCEENVITDIEEGYLFVDEEGKLAKFENPDKKKRKLSDADNARIAELVQDAVQNYEKYLSLSPEATDKDAVQERINELNTKVQ